MADEVGTAAAIAGFVVATATTVMGWLLNRNISQRDTDMKAMQTTQDRLTESHHMVKLDLANFKAEVSEKYAKDATVQASLARLYDRMDEGFKEIRDQIRQTK